MKISRLAYLIPAALVGAGCGSPTGASTEPVAFTHTVSFGFCLEASYCTSRLELSPQEAVLTYESRLRSPFVQRHALDAAAWKKVSDALDPAALHALPDVVGCPDCADGGAEAVTVVFADGQSDTVTFEYLQDVRGIQAVASALREIRQSFGPPPPVAAAP
jgi:hypothetical protein